LSILKQYILKQNIMSNYHAKLQTRRQKHWNWTINNGAGESTPVDPATHGTNTDG